MNISSIKYTNLTAFKSYTDDGIIGFDDTISQERRNYIRVHYDKWHIPYCSIYESEQRKNDYQMKILQKELEKFHEIKQIANTTMYRGQTLCDKPECIFELKNKGICMLIDLVGYGADYENAVKQAGLNYYVYNIYENWWNVTDFEQKHIDKLTDFLKTMQKGNLYIGCQHGSNDTDIALILNNFFNPLMQSEAETKISPSDSDFPIKLNTQYDMFSKSQKKILGWNPEFEQKLIKKLISI